MMDCLIRRTKLVHAPKERHVASAIKLVEAESRVIVSNATSDYLDNKFLDGLRVWF
jgi:hypothetical protein